MEAKMPDLYVDPAIREIQGRLDRQANEIVVLKGAVAALLTASEDVSTTRLANYISEAAQRPRGFGDPKSVPETTGFFDEAINATRGKRAP